MGSGADGWKGLVLESDAIRTPSGSSENAQAVTEFFAQCPELTELYWTKTPHVAGWRVVFDPALPSGEVEAIAQCLGIRCAPLE